MSRGRRSRGVSGFWVFLLCLGVAGLGFFAYRSYTQVGDLTQQLEDSRRSNGALNEQVRSLQSQLGSQSQVSGRSLVPNNPVSEPLTTKGSLVGGGTAVVAVDLRKGEWVQGSVRGGLFEVTVSVQDPVGITVQDFGRVMVTNFRVVAQSTGQYLVIVRNPNGMSPTSYEVSYTVYR